MSALLLEPLYRQQDQEAADEAREERIDALVPGIATKLASDEDFCELAMSELFGDPVEDLMQSAGKFFARYKTATTERGEAEAGYALYRDLKPYIEAAVKSQAESDARDEVARLEGLDRDDADEHRAEAA